MSRFSAIFGSSIILAWIVTVAILVRDHYITPEPVQEYTPESLFGSVTPVERWEDVEEYMLIIQTDAASGARSIVGASATEIRRNPDGGTTDTYRFNVRIEGKLSPLLPKARAKVSSILDKNVNLISFHGNAEFGPISFSATGAIANEILYLKSTNTGKVNYLKRPISGSVSMAEALRPALGNQINVNTGNQMSVPVIDPLTGKSRGTLTMRIGEKEPLTINSHEVMAYRVVSSLGDLETLMWVDEEGKTLRRQLVGGLAMERTTRDEALKVAPSLADSVEVPELDLTEFRGTGITRGHEEPVTDSTPGLRLLESLLR